jgi:hypothetical protein
MGSNDDNKLAATKRGLLEHDGVTHPFGLSSWITFDNIVVDDFVRLFLFGSSVLLATSLFVLRICERRDASSKLG